MKTISLRYTDKFAPEIGTIEAHKAIIEKKGYVWYGKMGTPVSQKAADLILNNDEPKFLLIHSGASDRYWMHVSEVSRNQPPYDDFPSYYHDIADHFKTWFKVIRIETAEKDVLSKCFVSSSGAPLSMVSRHSMNPYFIIEYEEIQNE